MSFTAGSTTTFSIRRRSAPIRCSAFRVLWTYTARDVSPFRRPPRGSSPLRSLRKGNIRSAGRPDTCRTEKGFARCEFITRRRQQRYVGVVMLSRLANSLYWMSRYVERAENVARFIDVNTWLSLDLPSGYQEQWSPLISTTGEDALFAKHYDEPSKRNVIQFLAFDRRNPNSIFS